MTVKIDGVIDQKRSTGDLLEVDKISRKKQFVSLFCTAYGTTYLFQQYFKNGLITYFLEKPIEPYRFKELLKSAVNKIKILQK